MQPHILPSFPPCQMDQFVSHHNGSNNESIDYSFVKGRNGTYPLTSSSGPAQSSVIQSGNKSSSSGSTRQSSSRSADFPPSNYYSHTGVRGHPYAGIMPPHALHPDASSSYDARSNLLPSSSPGISGSGGQQMSVIRRHESPGFPAMPANASAFYGMISPQSYPPHSYDFHKELQRYNMIHSLTASPKKLLRPS